MAQGENVRAEDKLDMSDMVESLPQFYSSEITRLLEFKKKR